jgi:hypothetical protein
VADELLLDGLEILTNGAENLRQVRGYGGFLRGVAQVNVMGSGFGGSASE